MGLVTDDIEWVLYYNHKPCFKWFYDQDISEDFAILGTTSKWKMGNSNISMQELNGELYEVEKTKRKRKHDTPIQVGIPVYSYAKLLLINFWEFLNKYLIKQKYELMYCDTDSLYLAISENEIEDCVIPELKNSWDLEKNNFFSSNDKSSINFEGNTIPFSQFDKRISGFYKLEFS